MTKIYIGITDPPITPKDGDIIENLHVIVESPTYGRVIFTDYCGVFVGEDVDVLIQNNIFEVM